MKDQLRREWTTLMQEGSHGQATRFRLRALRLAQMLRSADPELADALASGLTDTNGVTRLHQPSQTLAPAEVPDLIYLEQAPSLTITPHWPSPVARELQRAVFEWEMQDQLRSADLAPISSILLSGPPGVGKTLAARWLAQQVGLPLATLNLSATMNSHLGKTGQNITRALEYARTNPCILFLDEFDALAKRRDDDQDVGELKRVVNVLLQAIDQWDHPSLLVAATNHVNLLDAAIIRRFELKIDFPSASKQQIAAILKSLGVPSTLASTLAKDLEDQPISNATKLVNSARKRQVLEKLSFEDALGAVSTDNAPPQSAIQRRRAIVKTMTSNGFSSHQIAKKLDVSHTTVLRDIKSLQGGIAR